MKQLLALSAIMIYFHIAFAQNQSVKNKPSKKTMNTLELISHPLCPYNQRCVITLLQKGLERDKDFKVTYVDLGNLPDWFLKISPNKSFPVLKVNGEVILLKTTPINEFLNETTPGSLHSDNPIQKAKDRYWIEYASGPLDGLRDVYTAKDKEAMDKALNKVFNFLEPIEKVLEEKPLYFRGNAFTLVDGAYTPLFKLLFQFDSNKNTTQWASLPKTKHWAEHLISLEVAQKSATTEYAKEFAHFFDVFGSYFPKWVQANN
ncbi:MAG: glutathione S-transferase family protein [Cyclobacteriaceae bacterium]